MREYSLENSFCLYGEEGMRGITLEELLALQRYTAGDLLARPENSGSEGLYCEVARWNELASRWERFAFYKYLGSAQEQDARDAANAINGACWHYGAISIIHSMPSWESECSPAVGGAA